MRTNDRGIQHKTNKNGFVCKIGFAIVSIIILFVFAFELSITAKAAIGDNITTENGFATPGITQNPTNPTNPVNPTNPDPATGAGIQLNINAFDGQERSLGTLDVLFLFALLAVAPSLLIIMTSFTRIVIVLSFLRNALGTQQSPPNQIIIGMALFLSLFVMFPVIDEINTTAYKPYTNQEITQSEAIERGIKPLKVFMLKQTNKKDLSMFIELSKSPLPENFNESNLDSLAELNVSTIVPAFVTSELKRAFTMGFLIFIPFLIIDMVVSSTLMSMGMIMLPPAMIALPFKLMMFVLVDGWALTMSTLVKSFR